MSPLDQLPNTYRLFFGRFPALTQVQKALIQPILNGQDVVIQAGTGTGKTEAVLAPATERLMTSPTPFTIIYIVPTRALALDMNRRIKPLYKRLGLKSGIRTGDGKTLKDARPNLLILTPESLDVLLGSQNEDNKYFLKQVRFMIIDEAHMFLHEDRGYQLSYLRHRLECQSQGTVQTAALSATIHSLEEITSFFKLKNVFYYQQSATRTLYPCWVHLEDEETELVPFFDDLAQRFGCRKLLVFANSRKKCERLFDLLSQDGIFSQNVLLHYSNLSTKERRFIETSFRNNKQIVCIATSTLEMGIDIGDVDGVVLMGPPSSTTAFLQRIGRGNRLQQYIRFWGVCWGAYADRQLLRFLALFELAKENSLDCRLAHLEENRYSVLFQQILSCLYAKKALSLNSLKALFSEQAEECHVLFETMLAKNWLKPMPTPGLFYGGWRYMQALKQQKIWSNFPPTDEEYDVILEQDKIAVLPLSIVKQLGIGDVVQLTGKMLKVLQIEEKKASREVWVEESNSPANKDFFWIGVGIPTSFELAQKMSVILSGSLDIHGLLHRTKKLIAEQRTLIERAVSLPNGILVHRLGNNTYRYETFLGTTGNFIIHHLIKKQLSSKIEELAVTFDEMGIECNEWIAFESLEFPYSLPLFQEWIAFHLPLLKAAFSWNSWCLWLGEDHQQKEITAHLFDPRVLECFERYSKTPTPISLIKYIDAHNPQVVTKEIPLRGEPFSLDNEQQAWGMLSFPKPPSGSTFLKRSLIASQIQGYVTQKLCPRWARFQQLHYHPESHPRLFDANQKIQLRQQEGIVFKKKVIDELGTKQDVRFETAAFTWKEAVNEVISSRKPLFIAQVKFEALGYLKGNPDLIYIKPEGAHLCLEIWDIKNSDTCTYAQKWRVAFYAYMLECLLEESDFLLPIKVSDLGGLVYRSVDKDKPFERSPFLLAHYKRCLPRLLTQWEIDSMHEVSASKYTMDSSCTSCRYFSYCYQETLFTPRLIQHQAIVSLGLESNDFPKNTKHWFFIYSDKESIRWQCWENKETIGDTCIRAGDYLNWGAFQEAVVTRLHSAWHRSIEQGKNPHFLVYESANWHFFQNAFHSSSLKSLWLMHSCWTSLQSVLQKHFLWPISGRLTATQVALCLGLVSDPPRPLSLYHREIVSDSSFDLYRPIWNWCLTQVRSRRTVSFDVYKSCTAPLINIYLAIQHRENECRTHEILEFQKNHASTRVEHFRAISPLVFLGTLADGQHKCYQFSTDVQLPVSKFRVGDFLKLSPVESTQIQEGFSVLLESYAPKQGTLSVRPLSQKMNLSKKQLYALDENATDWNAPKIKKILTLLKNKTFRPELIQMLLGHGRSRSSATKHWVEQWYHSKSQDAGLNSIQKDALMLPFSKNIGLIEGPPGTGKTHLLAWTLCALLAHAHDLNRPIKILVTAQTHHAIDHILKKLAGILSSSNLDTIPLWKYGRYDQEQLPQSGILQLHESKPLNQNSSLILGATGFGVYQLLEGQNFPQLFDWVVFDEASQILPYSACLSLVFGKGSALFYGDTQQLPPILNGQYDNTSFVPSSILQELIARYGHQNRLRLNETYRMNEEICTFPSRHWYDGELRSAVSKNNQKLELSHYPLFHDLLDNQLNPSRSMVAVPLNHEGCEQSSQEEAHWIAKAVQRLIEDYSVSSHEIGIISPHRLQNNTILCALKETLACLSPMPKVDTVERMQGLEFDVVIFSGTASAKERIHSAFLKDYRRFNVALTRARKKFLFVASTIFFQSFPVTEEELIAHFPFEEFFVLYSTLRTQHDQ